MVCEEIVMGDRELFELGEFVSIESNDEPLSLFGILGKPILVVDPDSIADHLTKFQNLVVEFSAIGVIHDVDVRMTNPNLEVTCFKQ